MTLETIKLGKEIKTKLQTPMPDYIVKIKPGASKSSYVTGQAVIDKLNSTFGYAGWSWIIIDKWIEQSEDKVVKVKWENKTKIELPPDKWIYDKQMPVAHVLGQLSIFLERPDGTIHTVSKMAPGAQCLTGGQSEQENCYKGAHTDALKKAATMFGIALELYRDENEQYVFNESNYEDPWTDEMLDKFAKEREYIKNYIAKYEVSDEDFANFVLEVTGDSYDVTPDNIVSIVTYITDALAATETQE